MGDFDVVHGLFITGKPERVFTSCVQRLHFSTPRSKYSANWFSTSNVELHSIKSLCFDLFKLY